MLEWGAGVRPVPTQTHFDSNHGGRRGRREGPLDLPAISSAVSAFSAVQRDERRNLSPQPPRQVARAKAKRPATAIVVAMTIVNPATQAVSRQPISRTMTATVATHGT